MKKIIYVMGSILMVVGILAVATIKNIDTTEHGSLITFRNNTGYFIEK